MKNLRRLECCTVCAFVAIEIWSCIIHIRQKPVSDWIGLYIINVWQKQVHTSNMRPQHWCSDVLISDYAFGWAVLITYFRWPISEQFKSLQNKTYSEKLRHLGKLKIWVKTRRVYETVIFRLYYKVIIMMSLFFRICFILYFFKLSGGRGFWLKVFCNQISFLRLDYAIDTLQCTSCAKYNPKNIILT